MRACIRSFFPGASAALMILSFSVLSAICQEQRQQEGGSTLLEDESGGVRGGGKGLCTYTTQRCLRYPHLSDRDIDEDAETYESLPDVGQVESTCLSRARVHWSRCGAVPWEPVEMTFTPTGAKMAYPSADDVDKAVEEATRPLTGTGDGLTFEGFWKKTRIADNMQDFGAFPADKAFGIERNDAPRYEGLESWKVAFAWVDKHVSKGPSEGVPHPYPSLFNGENLADEWVMDVFKSKRRGIFIDLGANDAVHNSNTFTLERLGWDGLCIEPMYHHLPSLTHRKCKVVQAVVHKATGDEILFYKFHPSAPLGDKVFYGPWSDEARDEPELFTSFRTVTFEKVIRDFQMPDVIDYLSVDVDGSELEAMSTFPWSTHTIMSASVDFPGSSIISLFEENGLVPVKLLPYSQEVVFLNRAHPEYEQVMSRHHDPEALEDYKRSIEH